MKRSTPTRWALNSITALLFATAACKGAGEFYSFTVQSSKTGGKISASKDPNDPTGGKANHTVSIDITLSAFTPPASGYDIDWFFVAKGITSRKRWINGGGRTHVIQGHFTTTASPRMIVDGPTQTDNSLADLVTPQNAQGGAPPSAQSPGSKLEGWIVRLKRDGKVLQVEASSGELKTLAETNEKTLEDVVPQLLAREGSLHLQAAKAKIAENKTNCAAPIDILRTAGFDIADLKDSTPPVYLKITKKLENITVAGFTWSTEPAITDSYRTDAANYCRYYGKLADFSGRSCVVACDPTTPLLWMLVPEGSFQLIRDTDKEAWKLADDAVTAIETQNKKQAPAAAPAQPAASLTDPQT